MIRTSIRRAVVPGIAVIALAVTGCGASNESDGGSASDGDSGTSLSGELAGGGASSQDSAQQAWRAAFQGENSGVTITYDPVGSGAGRESFISGAYLFAGTDSYISDDEGELTKATDTCGAEPIEVPAYVSPIAVIFNLPGVDSLNLDAKTIAGIFAGKITTWDDAAIAALNDGVDLPSTKIAPVHRSDDSGTTKNFTDYLSKAGDGAWTDDPSDTWPLKGGESAEGTSGVVAAVKGGEGTIGYADDSQAGGLGKVSIKVGEAFNAPSADGAAKALEVSKPVEGRGEGDMAFDIDRTTTEEGAYPLLLTSYLLACPTYDDANDAELVKAFLTYIVSSDGQQAAADAAGSAPLPDSIAQQATDAVSVIAGK
ncbi:phosphate ABC transporter substrate-binding protein [Nocardioides sp. Root1257]|uniref:phosphate ABC transporter substrate-binding protein PstS n=1 Tax=unclassified Nocardioides TaxID=2615069 RepID=UPI0006FA11B9|nr:MULTISPECIES: phosphate ABC transporter substrate-binding protein PstS [unclassified Nocardioides]KQW48514.1 phosphate ABC transporter substrate-binding protein [Nocardioides sp. Root1257]KRC47690.1 phosphate ABC transporter substrate-binding protein [Nocardioides sp. Root224]